MQFLGAIYDLEILFKKKVKMAKNKAQFKFDIIFINPLKSLKTQILFTIF